tara:strand:- start:440 stop:619 length:180 start_codon:yes stop_codon:yes gene_type:complete
MGLGVNRPFWCGYFGQFHGGHADDSMHAPSIHIPIKTIKTASITHDDIFILSLAFAANS